MLFKKELTVTHSIEEEARVRGLLRDHGIRTFSDYPSTFSARPERSAVPRMGDRQTCIFYVKKGDYDRAVQVLYEAGRGA